MHLIVDMTIHLGNKTLKLLLGYKHMNKGVTTKLLNVEIWNFVTLNVQWCFSLLLKANLSFNYLHKVYKRCYHKQLQDLVWEGFLLDLEFHRIFFVSLHPSIQHLLNSICELSPMTTPKKLQFGLIAFPYRIICFNFLNMWPLSVRKTLEPTYQESLSSFACAKHTILSQQSYSRYPLLYHKINDNKNNNLAI